MFSLKRILLLLIFFQYGETLLHAQEKAVNRDTYRIHIERTGETMKTDGVLDEKSWQASELAENFIRVTPVDTGLATILALYLKIRLRKRCHFPEKYRIFAGY